MSPKPLTFSYHKPFHLKNKKEKTFGQKENEKFHVDFAAYLADLLQSAVVGLCCHV